MVKMFKSTFQGSQKQKIGRNSIIKPTESRKKTTSRKNNSSSRNKSVSRKKLSSVENDSIAYMIQKLKGYKFVERYMTNS